MICERASPGFRDASWEFGVLRAKEAWGWGADAGGLFCETNPIEDASWKFGAPRAKEAWRWGADAGGSFCETNPIDDASWGFGAACERGVGMRSRWRWVFCETNPIDDASWGFGVCRAKEAEAMG